MDQTEDRQRGKTVKKCGSSKIPLAIAVFLCYSNWAYVIISRKRALIRLLMNVCGRTRKTEGGILIWKSL